ncbi:unnamed protein product [Nezara viridula]|uniref:Uncharacterized protein n=1 Tax=Nezara viridula TaxID=85310 RepID=A0A9P0HT75_NEZVI|nr:unnamed protein product [Nezara viridula]
MTEGGIRRELFITTLVGGKQVSPEVPPLSIIHCSVDYNRDTLQFIQQHLLPSRRLVQGYHMELEPFLQIRI